MCQRHKASRFIQKFRRAYDKRKQARAHAEAQAAGTRKADEDTFLSKYAAAAASAGTKPIVYCPAAVCAELPTEIQRWNCLQRFVLAPIPRGKNPDVYYYVKQDCGGVGWGNNIRSIANSFALAALLGRRLIIGHFIYTKMFLRPTFAPLQLPLNDTMLSDSGESSLYDQYSDWNYGLSQDIDEFVYSATVLRTGMCGGDKNMITKTNCLATTMPDFVSCAEGKKKDVHGRSSPSSVMPGNALPAPFMYMIAQRPSLLLRERLLQIRKKLELPPLPANTEPEPGQWGLRTPGYFILGLHIRNHPIGFERLAIDLNQGRSYENKKGHVQAYFNKAQEIARRAAEIAKCRNETLLIYFATDDAPNLRPIATEKLSAHGRVVFGLDASEVGHMSSGWNDVDEAAFQRIKRFQSLDGEKSYGNHTERVEWLAQKEIEIAQAKAAGTYVEPRKNETFNMVEMDHSNEARDTHAEMAMTEWFVLAHTNWLVGNSGSSYAETAGALGLSPLGNMERLDMYSKGNSVSTTMRKKWDEDSCSEITSASDHYGTTGTNIDSDNTCTADVVVGVPKKDFTKDTGADYESLLQVHKQKHAEKQRQKKKKKQTETESRASAHEELRRW
eukprot:GSChrysophyteH2.ASY1.ANO1.801.1 assembled CDS